METPQPSVAPPPYSVPVSHTVSPALKITAIILVILAIIISIVAYTPFFHKDQSSPNTLVFGIPIGPTPFVYTFVKDANGKEVSAPLKAAISKEVSLSVVDIFHSDKRTFYLLLEATSTANIYEKQAGSFVKMSTSQSLKKDISYDSTSGMFAFEVVGKNATSSTPSEIVTFDPNTKTETKTGIMAARSVILPGGKTILGINDKNIDQIELDTGRRTQLLSISSPGTVGVKNNGSEIALFEPVTNTVQIYTYSSRTGVSFVKATDALPYPAVAVSYVGDSLYALYNDKTQGISTYVFKDLSNNKNVLHIPNVIPQFSVDRFVYE
jgi:uncharacterized membrane protein (DUF485 family)